jgi:hypothetical protein
MAFVHGHGRDTVWVRSHHRAPNRPDDGQLALPVDEPEAPVVPAPRPAPDDLTAAPAPR